MADGPDGTLPTTAPERLKVEPGGAGGRFSEPDRSRYPFTRDAALDRLVGETFDVLVIGGGITGAGVALDAAARGLSVAVVEGDDFASGTSSRSSKLVHGGLRYLEQGDYRLVYENLAERQRLLRNAGHLVRPLPFLIPVFGSNGVANRAFAHAVSSALWLYDLTGGVRIGRFHDRISKEEALAHMPTLDTTRLVDAFLYYDAYTDDARLTLELVRTAVLDHGAVAVNRARVKRLLHAPTGQVRGAVLAGPGCEDAEVSAAVVVNAAGVWADDVRALDEGTHPDSIRPAKGIHLTVPAERLPCDIAAVLTAREDKRSVFVVPWAGSGADGGTRADDEPDGSRPALTYVGTTDTAYDGPLDDPQCTAEDFAYLLRAVNDWLSEPITADDVVGSWAGLRPLVKGGGLSERTRDLSRRHRVLVSAAGMITITGGKLTTYRKMAADTVDVVVRRLADRPGAAPGARVRRSPTRRLRLRGAGGEAVGGDHLYGRYGREARVIVAMVDAQSDLGRPLVAGLPYLRAEAVYAARYEMATTVADVLARRTRALLLARDASADAADDVAALLGVELGWSTERIVAEATAYRALVDHERSAAGLSR